MKILTNEEITKLGGNPQNYETASTYWGESDLNHYFEEEIIKKMNERGLEDCGFSIKLVGDKKKEILEKIESKFQKLDFSEINEFFNNVFNDVLKEEGFKVDMEIPTATLVINMNELKKEDIEMTNGYNLRINECSQKKN